jgi:uracil-DNA glycosylase
MDFRRHLMYDSCAEVFPMVKLGNDWDRLLEDEFDKEYYRDLRQFLIAEYRTGTVYPPMHDIFNALRHTPYHKVKVVILGQDPYHGPGQAHGLCFSVREGIPSPPSLGNIYKELKEDLGIPIPSHGCLNQWADQGVLLLNTVLTVRAGEANSHKGKGWEILTDRIMQLLRERKEPMVFLLWGANAKTKAPLLSGSPHLVLTAAHPSPLSAYNGFYGCKHFSKANTFLQGFTTPVDWSVQ